MQRQWTLTTPEAQTLQAAYAGVYLPLKQVEFVSDGGLTRPQVFIAKNIATNTIPTGTDASKLAEVMMHLL